MRSLGDAGEYCPPPATGMGSVWLTCDTTGSRNLTWFSCFPIDGVRLPLLGLGLGLGECVVLSLGCLSEGMHWGVMGCAGEVFGGWCVGCLFVLMCGVCVTSVTPFVTSFVPLTSLNGWLVRDGENIENEVLLSTLIGCCVEEGATLLVAFTCPLPLIGWTEARKGVFLSNGVIPSRLFTCMEE